MALFIHHPARNDPMGSSPSWNHAAARIATWVWAPVEPEATQQDGMGTETQDSDPPAWSMRTMHWVPIVVPLAAVLMLVMAVLVGSRI